MYANPKKLLEIKAAKQHRINQVKAEKQWVKEEKERLRSVSENSKKTRSDYLAKLESEYLKELEESKLAPKKRRFSVFRSIKTKSSGKDLISDSNLPSGKTLPYESESKISYESKDTGFCVDSSEGVDSFESKESSNLYTSKDISRELRIERRKVKDNRSDFVSTPGLLLKSNDLVVHLVRGNPFRSNSNGRTKDKGVDLSRISSHKEHSPYFPYQHMFRDIKYSKPKVIHSERTKRMLEYYRNRVKVDFKPKASVNKSIELDKMSGKLDKKKKSFNLISISNL